MGASEWLISLRTHAASVVKFDQMKFESSRAGGSQPFNRLRFSLSTILMPCLEAQQEPVLCICSRRFEPRSQELLPYTVLTVSFSFGRKLTIYREKTNDSSRRMLGHVLGRLGLPLSLAFRRSCSYIESQSREGISSALGLFVSNSRKWV